MKFNIVIDVNDCPYRGRKYEVGNIGIFHICKHEYGIGECVSEYSTFEELCPMVKMGFLVKE